MSKKPLRLPIKQVQYKYTSVPKNRSSKQCHSFFPKQHLVRDICVESTDGIFCKHKKLIQFNSEPESLHFLREPTDGDVTPGGLIVFHCRASGGGSSNPLIRWRKNGDPLDLQQHPRYRQLRLDF